jgi:hypothetical protein
VLSSSCKQSITRKRWWRSTSVDTEGLKNVHPCTAGIERMGTEVETKAIPGCRSGPASGLVGIEHHGRRSPGGCSSPGRQPCQACSNHDQVLPIWSHTYLTFKPHNL